MPFHQDGAGVEQVKAPALRVLLRLGSGLGGDDRDVTACGRSVSEPGREQRGLDAPAAVPGRGCRAGELRDPVSDNEAGAAGGDPVAQCEVAHNAGGGEVALGSGNDIAGKVLVRGHTLGIGVGETFGDDIKPSVEFVFAASAYLDPRRSHLVDLNRYAATQYVLKRREPVAPAGQKSADFWVAEGRELDLHVRSAGSERVLDRVEIGCIRPLGEPETNHLVERRTRLGEGRDAASDWHHESIAATPAMRRGSDGLGDQVRLDTFHARGQSGIAEKRYSVAIRLHNGISISVRRSCARGLLR
jgi:hypothetical protein